jgi:hypothetical protein
MRNLKYFVLAVAGSMSLGTSAYAGGVVAAPEPGTLSIFGAAVAGLIIGSRFIRRK